MSAAGDSTVHLESGSNPKKESGICTKKRLAILAIIAIIIFAVVVGVAVGLSNDSDAEPTTTTTTAPTLSADPLLRAKQILSMYPLIDG